MAVLHVLGNGIWATLPVLGVVLLAACAKPEKEVRVSGETMGTQWSAVLHGEHAADAAPLLQARLDELHAMFTNWDSSSAVERFNRSNSTEWQSVPRELAEVVQFALSLSEASEGAFDITAAPLIEAWGFGPSGRVKLPPTGSVIADARRHYGWRHLDVQLSPAQLRKKIPQLQINVSALAEGYAVDDLVKRLRAAGVENFLLDVGGEIFASGTAPGGKAWQVGVQKPTAEKGLALAALPLRDEALATSGVYRQFFEHEGRRYAHVLNARTGWPVENALESVSVISSSCLEADGWATTLLILGTEEGREMANSRRLRALFVESTDS